nr:EAL domain-containing protein [Altericroceibacterium xinjiangense]
MAFQPIVDLRTSHVWGYEALVRGPNGEGAYSVLDQVSDELMYAFDQACRVRAIELASDRMPADGKTRLSINFKPDAVYEPTACIQATLKAARRTSFNPRQLMFEFTEDERMRDVDHVRRIVETYRQFGFMTAVDDFGAGYAGLSLLADLLPDLIKLDRSLLQGIDRSEPRRRIVHAIVQMTNSLGITCLAEGLETREEVETVRDLGIDLCQGFYFAKPAVGQLPEVAVELLQ